MNGCEEDLEKPVAVHAGEEFVRCPRLSLGPDEEEVLGMHAEGYLRDLSARERRLLPAKLFEALAFVADLLPRERDDAGRGR